MRRRPNVKLTRCIGLFFSLISGAGLAVIAQTPEESRLEPMYRSALSSYGEFESIHRRFQQVQHVKISYLEWGDPKNTEKVFIWLHGSLSNAYELTPFADTLVAEGYRVISIDQYRHGRTSEPDFDASFEDLCLDIYRLLDQLNIDTVVLGGFSRGAYLATHFFDRYPNRVAALVLEDGGSVCFSVPYLKLDDRALATKLQQVNIPQEIAKRHHGFHSTQLDAYRSLYDPDNPSNQFEILSYITQRGQKWVTYRGLPEYYHMRDSLQMAETLFHPEKVSQYASSIIQVNPTRAFAQLSVPVLILDATSLNDPIPVEVENRVLAKNHPEFIRHIVFQNVEHNIHFAQPEKFIAAVLEFLTTREGGG